MFLLILTLICHTISATNVIFDPEDSICFTSECVKSSSRIRTWINESFNPCDDFYNYVCGGYVQDNAGSDNGSPLKSLNELILGQVTKMLENETDGSQLKAFTVAKKFYKKCTKMDVNDKDEHISRAHNLLSSMEHWPLFNGTHWVEEEWSLVTAVKKLRQKGLPYGFLFDVSLIRDQRNTSKILLKLDSPKKHDSAINLSRIAFVQDYFTKIFPETEFNTTIKDYMEVEKLLFEAIKTEDSPNGVYTMKKLQLKYNYLDWMPVLHSIIGNEKIITKNTEIFVNDVLYFVQLRKFLKSTSKRMLANYFFIKILAFLVRHNLQQNPDTHKCTLLTKKLFPVSVNAMYVQTYFTELPKDATRVTVNMQRQLRRMIKRSDWLSSTSKIAALEKLQYMTVQLGFSNVNLNDTIIENYYKKLVLNPNRTLIEDEIAVNAFNLDKKFKRYGNIAKMSPKYSDVSTTNAFYDFNRNAVSIPVGLLQSTIFAVKRPNFLNYASFGSIVSFALGSAFSVDPNLRDKHGNKNIWWEDEAHQSYVNKTKCIKDQTFYKNKKKTVEKSMKYLVADIISLKTAYLSYRDWSQRHFDELGLPFMKFTANQLLWISIAQNRCKKYKGAVNDLQTRNEQQYRVNGALRNILHFAEDFECPEKSFMNPSNKCEIL